MKFFGMMAFAGLLLIVCPCCSIMDPAPTSEGSMVSAKLAALPRPDPAQRKTATVYKFKAKASYRYGGAITRGATDQFMTALVKSGHFRVVERSNLDQIAAEKNLQRAGEATGKAGSTKLKGAQYIFMGAITELDETSGTGLGLAHWGVGVKAKQFTATVGMDIRVVDAGTGEVLDSIDVRKKVRDMGFGGSYKWGVSGSQKISKAMSLAVRECIEEAVYQLVTRYGVK